MSIIVQLFNNALSHPKGWIIVLAIALGILLISHATAKKIQDSKAI